MPITEERVAELKRRQIEDEPAPLTEVERLRCENLSLKRELLQERMAGLDEEMNLFILSVKERLGVAKSETLIVNPQDWTVRLKEKNGG